MNTREKMKKETREEWRDLGFYYLRDDTQKVWSINGSRSGLSGLADLLRQYTADPRNNTISEHDHLPPYRHFKIMTWTERDLTESGIDGTIEDLLFFAELLETKLANAQPRETFSIGPDYCPTAKYCMAFTVEPDNFDPASLDPMQWADNIE